MAKEKETIQAKLDAELERARLTLGRLRLVDGNANRVISLLFVGGEFTGAGLHRAFRGETEDELLARVLEGMVGGKW